MRVSRCFARGESPLLLLLLLPHEFHPPNTPRSPRLCHTLHLLASLCFWSWTTRTQHVCRHCGHRPESVFGVEAGATAAAAAAVVVGRDSDEATAYDEFAEQDAEDAMLLKVDAEA